jgi:hypothetical protein
MSRMTFDWGTDDITGNTGWIARGYPHFYATETADLLVHDCLEHLPGGTKHGGVADELMALGARWRIRVESGFWAEQRYFYRPETTFGQELSQLLIDLEGNNATIEPPRNVPEIDGWLPCEEIIQEALEYHKANTDFFEEEESRQQFEVMCDWLKVGYQATFKRFGQDAHEWEIMELGKRLETRLKSVCGDYGDTLKVVIDERALDFKVIESSRLY